MSEVEPRLRLGILGIIAASLFAVLLARLWVIQVVSNDVYEVAAQENTIRTISIPAPRGRILAADGVSELVRNRPSNVVFVDKAKLGEGEREPLLRELATVLGQPVEVLAGRLDDLRASPYAPVPVAEDVSEAVLVRLRERAASFPAVVADTIPVRDYPEGTLAAHVLGYVGEVNAEEASGGTYELGDLIGRAGIEQVYDADLRGENGEVRVEVDADGVPIKEVDRRPPVQGDDVVLSIDLEAQRVAELSLAQGLEAARRTTFRDDGRPLVADAGSAVVLDAEDGTVVAMASYPTYDPEILINGITTAEYAILTGEGSGAPFTNRATQGEYAPGSTWKLVTGLAALQNGLISGQDTVVDEGVYTLPDCRGVGCVKRNAGSTAYGRVAVGRAMTVSSDIFFYDLGYRFWVNRAQYGDTAMQDMASRLGIGADTGVELPVENDGLLITPALRAQRHADNPVAFPEGQWFHGSNVNLAIGQGDLTVTPLQLANAYASFATGTRYAPNLVLRVQRQDQTVVREVPKRPVGELGLLPEDTFPILDGLIGVTTRDGGTAANAFRDWPHGLVTVAGKTGTAQAGAKQDTALFAAFAPASAPKYSVSVVMEQAGFGATSAAPVARAVLASLLDVEPVAPVEIAEGRD